MGSVWNVLYTKETKAESQKQVEDLSNTGHNILDINTYHKTAQMK